MKRASTQRERKAERMRHTERMRKTITAKPANMGNLPPQKSTHETHCHIDHEADRQPLYQIFNAGWSGAEASFQILLYFSSLFHNIDFFLCLVGGFTLLVSGGGYGRGENMQGFW